MSGTEIDPAAVFADTLIEIAMYHGVGQHWVVFDPRLDGDGTLADHDDSGVAGLVRPGISRIYVGCFPESDQHHAAVMVGGLYDALCEGRDGPGMLASLYREIAAFFEHRGRPVPNEFWDRRYDE